MAEHNSGEDAEDSEKKALDPEVMNKIKFRLMMVRASRDEPLVEADMIAELEKVYKERGVKPTAEIKDFLSRESGRIRNEIETELTKKQEQLDRIAGEKAKSDTEQEERKKVSEDKEKKITRTQQIFGSGDNTKGKSD